MECGDFGLVIIRSHNVRDRFSACLASVDDHPALGPAVFDSRGLHHPAAEGLPVAGSQVIHVLAPEATRAVVAVGSVLQRFHGGAAVLADEGLLAGDERGGRQGRQGVRGRRRMKCQSMAERSLLIR